MKYSIPKGVFDILPNEPKEEDQWRSSHHWIYIEEVIRKCANDFGFKEIRLPLFEQTELFVRGVGESSDIVSKEMYTFLDKADRSLTLRPEGTASTIRAFIEKKLYTQPGLHKYYYIGPMFRYERPQAGRYRQHHQFGAEAIGVGAPEQDVEMIHFLWEFYHRLGLKNLYVQLNSVGDEPSRASFRKALTSYLEPHFSKLSEDSQVRFSRNILRILDSKSPEDQALLEGAPSLADHLSLEAKDHFNKVQQLLRQLKIPFEINLKLVRGLDYYNQTVFEITSSKLGSHNTIGAGGRYDGLTEAVGGPYLPSVGFATGLERVLQTLQGQNIPFPKPPHPIVFFVPLGPKALHACFLLVAQLREEGISAEIDLSEKKVQQGLKLADSTKSKFCVVLGERELETGEIELKEMASRTSQTLPFHDLISFLRKTHV